MGWILDLETQGHAPTFTTIRELVAVVSKASGGTGKVGKNWVPRFIQRHPEIHSKVGKKIDAKRVKSTTSEVLESWFQEFKTVKERYNIQWKNSYNMDEVGVALGVYSNQTTVGTSNTSFSIKKTPESREWVSMIEVISAIGQRLQTLVIFKGKNLQTSWFHDDNIPNFLYTTSPNGWTLNEIGLAWLEQIFLP